MALCLSWRREVPGTNGQASVNIDAVIITAIFCTVSTQLLLGVTPAIDTQPPTKESRRDGNAAFPTVEEPPRFLVGRGDS